MSHDRPIGIPNAVHVSVTVFRECDPSLIYGVYDTLWAAGWVWDALKGQPTGQRLFQPRLVAAEPGPVELITGVRIVPQDTIADVHRTDIVFVPNVWADRAESMRSLDRRLLDRIGRMHAQGAQLYSSCGGSLALAEAGLLDGGEATTHWKLRPAVPPALPQRETAGGPHPGAGRAGPRHRLLGRRLVVAGPGPAADRQTRGHRGGHPHLEVFLYQWHRDGQLPYASMMANVDHGDSVVERCQAWLSQNYEHADIVAELVRRSGLPKRTFDRRFRAATGYSPLAYIQALRIEEAKQMLETGSAPVEAVAREVGYEDAASFRRLFRRLAGVTPGDYRRKFQVPHMVARAAAGARPRAANGRMGVGAPAPGGAVRGRAV